MLKPPAAIHDSERSSNPVRVHRSAIYKIQGRDPPFHHQTACSRSLSFTTASPVVAAVATARGQSSERRLDHLSPAVSATPARYLESAATPRVPTPLLLVVYPCPQHCFSALPSAAADMAEPGTSSSIFPEHITVRCPVSFVGIARRRCIHPAAHRPLSC
jgi:hypothetical protein